MELFSLALTFFLVTNPIGNCPIFLPMVRNLPVSRQRFVLLREAFLAMLLAYFYQFLGEIFLQSLRIEHYALDFCGGILLFYVAISMIFPVPTSQSTTVLVKEPYLVPIATPLLAGPALMTVIMLYSKQVDNAILVTSAITVAWVGVYIVMLLAAYINQWIGIRALYILEQVLGMILAMMGVEMVVSGVKLFTSSL